MKMKSHSGRRLSVWSIAMILIALAVWWRSGWSRDGLLDALAMLVVGLSLLGFSRALLSEGSK